MRQQETNAMLTENSGHPSVYHYGLDDIAPQEPVIRTGISAMISPQMKIIYSISPCLSSLFPQNGVLRKKHVDSDMSNYRTSVIDVHSVRA
jgi:hypothetical protein